MVTLGGLPVEPIEIEVSAAMPAALRKKVVGRSPGQLAWMRLKRDRIGVASGIVLIFFVVIAVSVPLIEAMYGIAPEQTFTRLLNSNAIPLGYSGGVSGDHWFGIEPRLGRDVFILTVHGIRTSLTVAFASAFLSTVIGVVLGIVAGFLGGWVDTVIGWVIDFVLALPFLIFALAVVPVVQASFFSPREAPSVGFRGFVLVGIFAVFGWTYTARLVRGQVLSLREREYVEAARAAGASTAHILFRQLLPNLWAPILITFSLAVPGYVTAEGALSFLNVGIPEPAPDLGRMIFYSTAYLQSDQYYFLFAGVTLFLIVLSFNLFGDSLRDALDPKSSR
jgi:peptide/nickel transport system permease protein